MFCRSINGMDNEKDKALHSTKLVNEDETSSGTQIRSPTEDLNEREERLEQKWKKPSQSSFVLVQEMLERGLAPSQILQSLIGSECKVPSDISESMALRLLIQFVSERRFRHRLPEYNDFTHAVELFRKSKNILIISGAGISTSCGIPDFRSTKGIYASLKQTFPDLPHPTAMFDIDYFKARPQPFYSFAKEIFPGAFKPSVSHMFVKFLEDEKKLLRNYTQNIDTLERLAGIQNYVECHGSFATATCLQCSHKFTSDDIREDIYTQKVALCPHCSDGLIKPDIVFFGENLPDHFHLQMAADRDRTDLVVVIGSSLQVQPVSLIPYNIDEEVPQILINKEDLGSYNADIKLIGDCDSIIVALSMALGGRFRECMIEELKSRSMETLRELEPLLAENSDSFLPTAITDKQIKEQLEEDEEEIPAKRMKTDEGESSSTSPLDPLVELQQMYEAKFIHIPSLLKGHSYAKFPPNLNVFKGADFYYDTDQQSFGALPRRREADSTDEDGYESDGQTSSSSNSSANYCRSNPETERTKEYEEIDSRRRAESCPPFWSGPNSSSSPSPSSSST